MKVKEFHWWSFSRELQDGDEIECPMCKTWTKLDGGWSGKIGRCNGCMTRFVALFCPACNRGINHHVGELRVWQPGEELVVEEKAPQRPPWARKKKGC